MAQTSLSGRVADAGTKEGLAGASISIKGRVAGTITDARGNFTLNTNASTPFTLLISSVGYKSQEITIQGNRDNLTVELVEQPMLGQEVVVSASRVEESVMQSPVTVEKMDIRAIRNTPSANFYDALRNLKGVELSTQSLTFSSVNTRGFTGNGNVRVVQMIDGMDNQAPGLNFSVGNIVGISELDLESVELLPGAASALYGPNATNGLLLMTSKSPFLYQGLSAYAKTGIMSASNRANQNTPFYDVAIRYAKAFNNKVAFKINAGYLTAQDWEATDTRDMSFTNGNTLANGTRQNNPNYNGVNIYGDENPTSANLLAFRQQFAGFLALPAAQLQAISPDLARIVAGVNQISAATGLPATQIVNNILLPNAPISRTGYAERDLVDYRTGSLKLNGALHYRINDRIEAIAQGSWGNGTTVYTGNDRYYIDNFKMGQYKVELRGPRFFVRAYTTQERSGDAFAIGTLGLFMNEAWKPSLNQANLLGSWYPQYAFTYAGGALQTFSTAIQQALAANPTNPAAAYQTALNAVNGASGALHTAARNAADQGRIQPGSEAFNQIADQVKQRPIPNGARFLDKTNLYHAEFMTNLSSFIDPKIAEVLIGGNYRVYDLNSEGTLFAQQPDGSEFNISEYGAYIQASKTIADALKLTGSLRYDKNENFAGQFSPRLSAVYTINKVHNIRASYQTGFRIPTTQDQYIDLNTPQARLIGGLPYFVDKYQLRTIPSYTLESVNAGQPQQFTFPEFKPERVLSFEVGYKGLIANRFLLDVNYYNSTYRNLISGQVIVQPTGATTRNVYSLPTNYTKDVRTQGFGIGVDYLLPRNFTVGGNLSNNTLNTDGVTMFNKEKNRNVLDDGFMVGFNTPKYRYNLNFGNRNISNSGWGFNIVYRHQDAFYWQSSFIAPAARLAANNQLMVVPAINTLDAQVSKRIPSIRSILKLGGSNILKQEYTTGIGNPTVGSMYYISLTFDELLN
ncbi:TonB-dependent receptor [Nibrella saemangeumensis]|uniref:TonB-dependent receptor n=2 Tax=Nibrella saemangeumensis TaxID=1084526 RepID=A0ABP8NMU3_9BACT